MWNKKPVSVLKGLKITFKLVCLNMRHEIRLFGIEIPRIFFTLLFANGIITMYILSIIFCVKSNFDLNLIAAPMSVFWGCMQITLMYLSFSRQNTRIVQTLDALDGLVARRCTRSPPIKRLYEQCEEGNWKMAKSVFIFGVFSSATLFGSTALIPISYATLGFPPPENWTLPIPV